MNSNSNNNGFAIHQFGDILIYQANGDLELSGKTLPHGYVNLSNLCRVKKTKLLNYLRNKDTLSYFQAMLDSESFTDYGSHIRVPDNHKAFSDSKILGLESGLLIELTDIIGGNGDVYGQIEIALDVCKWISPELRVWANRTLVHVINNDFLALTPEAAKAQEKLQQIWNEVRQAGKVTRRTWTDSIKDYMDKNEVSDNYRQWIYKHVSDSLNKSLFGKTAKQLKEERNITTDELLRDSHSQDDISKIDRIEAHAMKLVDKLNTEPKEALKEALDFWM